MSGQPAHWNETMISQDFYRCLPNQHVPTTLWVQDGEEGAWRIATGQEVCQAAAAFLVPPTREVFANPEAIRSFLRARLGLLEFEMFAVMHLDAQNRLIEYREMFRGTHTQTSVYPREVVQEALELKTAAVVFVHNHPSGLTIPSQADERLTQTLKKALDLIDVRVLDHLIVGRGDITSMAEKGLL